MSFAHFGGCSPISLSRCVELGAQLAPSLFAERSRHRIAIEHRKHERAHRIELRVPILLASAGSSTPSTSSATMASPIG